MKKKLLVLSLVVIVTQAVSWGLTGHRVVGQIAEDHLTRKAKKQLKKIMGDESLSDAANWMDFIRSDHSYDYMVTWHYVTIPDGETYATATRNPKGDLIWAINHFSAQLRTDTLTRDEARFAVRCLTHLVGDLHQPLHVGNGKDKGGNDVKINWFWKSSNLHRVWDSQMIDDQLLSYTEWVKKLDHLNKEEIAALQSGTVVDWATESMAMRTSVYDFGDQKNLTYAYNFRHQKQVERQLLKAGIRLAGLFNNIFR